MAQQSSVKKDASRIFTFALAALFLVPLTGWLFTRYAEPHQDELYLAQIERSIDKDPQLDDRQKRDSKAFFRANVPSSTCDNPSADVARYRASVCGEYSELWQFHLVRKISVWMLAGGVAVLAAVLVLGAIAFVNRRSQYLSFVLGWRLLTLTAALEVVVQGALLVWLSFWLTAFFFQIYVLKLIALAAIGTALAAFYAVVSIFKRPSQSVGIEGELVAPDDSPALWAHVRGVADRLKTAAPDHIVAGIDTNFFVTEAPLKVGDKTLTGRSLFVSLPLLRLLDRSEADAVLAHEFAHFSGGDTASSAALGPKLVQYDYYCQMMDSGVRPVFFLMATYRVIFELALRRDSRAREFLADRTAAGLVSAQSITRSLIKIAAYAGYRSQIEQKLFEHDRQHGGALGIAQHVASGLAPYANSAQFLDAMKSADIPHPFNSHPPMRERMANVGHVVDERDYSLVVTDAPGTTWVSDIAAATAIEQRQWSVYEQRFAAMHEESLAYRYQPANDAEREIVSKYFPPIVFQLKGGKRFQITYAGVTPPEAIGEMSWDSVKALRYQDGTFGDVLTITHPEKGRFGAKTTKVKLPGLKKDKERFKAVLAHYWRRHQVMRQGVADGTRGV